LYFYYSAESPSQVFLTILSSVYNHVVKNSVPVSEWKKIFVIYDNVCNLNRIRAAQQPLPLPSPYDRVWMEVSKVLDVFHLANHTREECLTVYHPRNIKIAHPTLKKRNTEIAEQTFAWLVRFKPVLNRVPRNRQLFYLNRLIKHRNAFLVDLHA